MEFAISLQLVHCFRADSALGGWTKAGKQWLIEKQARAETKSKHGRAHATCIFSLSGQWHISLIYTRHLISMQTVSPKHLRYR